MLLFSQQIQIINSVCVSFEIGKKIHTKTPPETDRFLYKFKKYETMPRSDFHFLVVYLVYRNFTNKYDTYKLLNELSKEEIKRIWKIKDRVISYKKSIKEDILYTKTKIITPENIFKMLQKNEITPFAGFYYLQDMYHNDMLSRLQKRKYKQLKVFVDYFPVILEYLNDLNDSAESV